MSVRGRGLRYFSSRYSYPLNCGSGFLDVGEHPFLALEQLQAHVGGSEVARQADQVVQLRAAAVDDALVRGVAQRRHRDDESGHRGPRVAAHQVDPQLPAGEGDPLVEVLQRLDGDFRRDAERDGDLRRRGVHRQDVAHARRHDLVAEVAEREIGQVEVHALIERIGRAEHLFARGRGDDGGVVAHAPACRGVVRREGFGQQVDQPELAERCDLGAFFLLHG